MPFRGNDLPLTRLRRVLYCLLIFCLAPVAAPQRAAAPAALVPPESGEAGLQQALRRLQTTARLMHITAHPDDEDGAMLALEARGRGASVLLLTLNRGEGGQNRTGSNLFDELGVLRTLELLASDRYYGVEQRFTRVVDFGYSKSAAETFEKWHGHDTALADVVRVIREFRPDVVVSRFQGSSRDGHGHHEASGILAREAFHAAADPQRFPEQFREGLLPWQASKLYVDNARPPEASDVQLKTDTVDPLLGTSCAQFAMEGLRHQLSQGAGQWRLSSGPHFSYYRLAEVAAGPVKTELAQKDFFDGIDVTLAGLAARLGGEEAKAPFLGPALAEIERAVTDAVIPHSRTLSLLKGRKRTADLMQQIQKSALSEPAKVELLTPLRTKLSQFTEAANLAAGLRLEATAEAVSGVVVPGQTFSLRTRLTNSGVQAIVAKQISLHLPAGWTSKALEMGSRELSSGGAAEALFTVSVPPDAAYTRPYYHRSDPESETVYTIDDPRYATLPLPPPPVVARATYSLAGMMGEIETTARAHSPAQNGPATRPLAVVPAFSVLVEPGTLVIPASRRSAEIQVAVRQNIPGPAMWKLHLETPAGWQAEPAASPPAPSTEPEKKVTFTLRLPPLNEGRYQVRAVLEHNGKPFREGYSVVTRQDLETAYYYQPAMARVSALEVKLPPQLKIGYIMGAGDDIPQVLTQLGMNVKLISPEELAGGDLERYDTIVAGIRAYDTRPELRQNTPRLLRFVENGGTLLVQYNTGVADFNAGNFTPYPAQLGRDRVSVEESPVEVLIPQDPLFHFPNAISARDFDGWVQERGLYFMSQWDSRFQALLAGHDPGEPPLQGGLLRARYGKGTYIYTGYAFFRQLPAGVPGAIRLYVNLLSAGHEPPQSGHRVTTPSPSAGQPRVRRGPRVIESSENLKTATRDLPQRHGGTRLIPQYGIDCPIEHLCLSLSSDCKSVPHCGINLQSSISLCLRDSVVKSSSA